MKKIGKVLLILDLVIVNSIAIYFVYSQIATTKLVTTSNAAGKVENSANLDICPASCVSLISGSELISVSPTPINLVSPTPTTKPTTIAKPKVKYTSYIPVPGSGNTLATDWTDISGTDFYMSTSDYPGLTGVYFEANIKLMNGNGTAYVRIYDVTNGRGVDLSTLSTSSQSSTFVSGGPISLWAGYNHYRIQLKTLTADSAIFESGRLKIISEN